MKLSEYKNEDALDLLADLLDPVAHIFADEEVKRIFTTGTKIETIRYVLKNHSKRIIEILARLEGVEAKDYNANIAKMTASLLEILNDEELIGFFTSQELTEEKIPSGSVTEITKERKK